MFSDGSAIGYNKGRPRLLETSLEVLTWKQV